MRTLIIIALALTLAACASTPDPHYSAYLQAVSASEQRDAAARGSIADAAASCNGNETCVVAVAGFAALSMQGGSSRSSVQPYRKQFHPAWGILGQALPVLAQAAVSWHSSDNSRDIALGQYGFLGGVIDSVTSSPALLPRDPSITVGGDYISGSVGDSVGGDQVGGNQHIGDSAGRDLIGGDQHVGDTIGGDDNSGNSGRINSPGPFDNSGQCTGLLCQGEGTPPPADPDTGG